MTVENRININSSKATVWEVITDFHNAPKLIKGIEKIELLYKPPHNLIGLKWRETRLYFGKPAAIDKWITDAVENSFYQTR